MMIIMQLSLSVSLINFKLAKKTVPLHATTARIHVGLVRPIYSTVPKCHLQSISSGYIKPKEITVILKHKSSLALINTSLCHLDRFV